MYKTVFLLFVALAFEGACSGPDPSPNGTCVIGCSSVCKEGAETDACKTCIALCEGEP